MSAKPKSESSDHDGSDITNESSTNSTTSSSSQESWFKSLKRNLSSKRKGGKQARSGGNIREFLVPTQLHELFCWVHHLKPLDLIGKPWANYHLEMQLLQV